MQSIRVKILPLLVMKQQKMGLMKMISSQRSFIVNYQMRMFAHEQLMRNPVEQNFEFTYP